MYSLLTEDEVKEERVCCCYCCCLPPHYVRVLNTTATSLHAADRLRRTIASTISSRYRILILWASVTVDHDLKILTVVYSERKLNFSHPRQYYTVCHLPQPHYNLSHEIDLDTRKSPQMATHCGSSKKRPPPIDVPPSRRPSLPQGAGSMDRQERHHVRNPSGITQPGQQSADTSALTTPVDPAGMRLPPSGSGRSRNAIATFANFIEQSRVSSPRKSDQGHDSTAGSRRGSTARSRQSGRSQYSAAAVQAQLEALDEETARGKIESRSERNMFKMTGQVPPTPTTGGYTTLLLKRLH